MDVMEMAPGTVVSGGMPRKGAGLVGPRDGLMDLYRRMVRGAAVPQGDGARHRGPSGVAAVETFAAGLERNGTAVRAAPTTPWSGGRTAGRINTGSNP